MPTKVNLKKYLPIGGKWQFVPVLKVEGKPKPEVVVIGGEPVRRRDGKFYLDWRQDGKRIQKTCGVTAREALDAWRTQTAILEGVIAPLESEDDPEVTARMSITDACETYLAEVKALKKGATYESYKRDLEWFKTHLRRSAVGKVTRKDIIHLFSVGRDLGLSQGTINRAVMVGLMAIRNAGATVAMKKGDWPPIPKTEVTTYDPDQILMFFKACTDDEKLLFQTYLMTGFRNREVATLRWSDIDAVRATLRVCARPEYKFTPKSHEERTVPVPAQLIRSLHAHRRGTKSALVFPTKPHPKRKNYGGDAPDAHHLELCKEIADRAGLDPSLFWLHKWRHTYATNMLQSGVDIKSLQVLLGHKNIMTTERYLKSLHIDEIRSKVENSKLAAFF